MGGSVSAIKTRIQAMNVTAELVQQLLSFEEQDQKRKVMITFLERLIRKIARSRKRNPKEDRHKKVVKRKKDRHINPSQDRHINPSQDRHINPSQNRYINPSQDRHINPSQDRHINPSQNRHVKPTNNETGTFNDFLWTHRHESALLAALCFAEEARAQEVDEMDLNAMDDVDILNIVRKFQSFIKSRSGGRVCGVCGVVGLEGRGVRISLKEFKAWIVRSTSKHDDSMAATLKREIESQDGPSRDKCKLWREHLHLHSVDDVEYILCGRGVTGEIVDVCSRCKTRTEGIRSLCARNPEADVYLSRCVEEKQTLDDDVIIFPAPECSFAQFDPGKILQAGLHLSTLEKTALAEFVVAGNVHKVRNARDVIAAWRLTGHTIVFPIDTLGVVSTRTVTLPRTDIADLQRVMWTGPKSTYVGCHASILNLRKLKMRYSDVVNALQMLKIMHPRYKNVSIASKDDVKWEEQKESVHKHVIHRADGVREAAGSSDIAAGWDPKCVTKQTHDAPKDGDFGTVMIVGKDGLKADPEKVVHTMCQAVRKAKESKTTISMGAVPINEYSNFAEILSGGFPVEFPLGVTDDNIGGGGGPMHKNHLHRLMRFYDGRVSKNETLLMYLCDVTMRHASQGNVTARVKKESAGELVQITNNPQFITDCAVAEKDPESTEAKELVQQIGPLIRVAGAHVPWGPLERLSATHHLYALYHTFGPPAFFITFAPKTLTNELVLIFGQMQSDGNCRRVEMQLPQNLQRRYNTICIEPHA